MKVKNQPRRIDRTKRFTVILTRPEKPENIGLVARGMRNTGFDNLRIVKTRGITPKSYATAVHAREILDNSRFYSDIAKATEDLDIVFAATSRARKNFFSICLDDAVSKMIRFPLSTKIGLLFGNERTGLTSEELGSSNFRFTIPQASAQPSYNLASAVLLTLFSIYTYAGLEKSEIIHEKPLSQKEQKKCIALILDKLEETKFIHTTNRVHVTEMIQDLFGRLGMTEKDRKLLLALFSKGVK